MKRNCRFQRLKCSALMIPAIALQLLCVSLYHSAHAAAPITPSGLNTQVNLAPAPPPGKIQYDITGGTRAGANLFHSFGDFNVPNNNIANFLNASGLPTSNILGRVTGGNISNIFGTIQTTGFGNANLFLMNPAGFLFGPNATVNVGGMAAFTSADYLRLADGVRFNAVPNPAADALLSTAPVAAYGFLGSDPGAITVQGSQLTVTAGQSISLVGGNITLQSGTLDDGTVQSAKLSAAGGQINLASLASPGEVLLSNLQLAPNVNGQSFTAMGNINLSEGAVLDVSANAGGTVHIRSGQLAIAEGTISADTVNTNGAPTAVDIQLTGDLSIANDLNPAITARTTGTGDAGKVSIVSSNMTASSNTDGFITLIDTHTSGSGKAGDVSITTGNLQALSSPLFGLTLLIDAGTEASGHGGDVTLTAKNVNMEQWIGTGNLVSNLLGLDATGSAGNVKISAESLKLAFVQIATDAFSIANGTGQAGNIDITAHDINLNGSAFSAAGHQRAGLITVNTDQLFATNTQFISQGNLISGGGITVNGRVIELSAGSSLVSSTGGDGNAGPIIVTATDHLTLSRGSISDRPSGIFSNSFGTFGGGNAGDITINTPTLVMDGGARINTITASSGHGGNVTIKTTGPIIMSGETGSDNPEPLFSLGVIQPSGIFTGTIGGNCSGPCGNAGNISITGEALSLGSGAQINSGTSTTGHGGNITIHVSDTISLSGNLSDGKPAGVFSRTIGTDAGSGNGGNIELHAAQLQVTKGAQISASTLGTGNAGDITIQGPAIPAQSVLINGAGSGLFTTTSGTGTGGNITVEANAVTLQNGAHLSSSSTGPGSTGNIQINAGNQFAMTNSSVTTEALHSSGGAIKITTNPNGTVRLTDSTISASVLDGTGGGGSVNIDPQYVVLQNSQILANAVFGPGGNINITTNLLLADPTSAIHATSQFGQQGTVTIQSPIAPAGGKIVPLGQKPLLPTSLLSQRCAAIAGGTISSFTVAGRDSLPSEPGGLVSTPLSLMMSESEDRTVREAGLGTTSNEALEETPLLSLRKIAPPGFLTQSFAVDSSAGCTS